MTERVGAPIARYAAALVSVAAAAAMRFAFDPLLGDRIPFTLFFVAVLFSAWYGGLGPGLVATALSAITASFLFVTPRHTLFVGELNGQIAVGLFSVVSFAASVLVVALRRAVHEAHHERESLKSSLRSIGDGVIEADEKGRIVYLNPVAEQLTGWPLAEAKGKPLDAVFRIVDEQTRRTVENPVEKALRTGGVVGLANHTVLIARDGTERPIDDSAAPIRGAEERVHGVILVFRDVSERRRAEQVRQHLAAIVSSSDDAIISKSLEGTITSWNAGAQRLYGYLPEEAIGQPISLIVPPDRMDELREIFARLERGERIDHFETVRQAKDGRRLDVSITISPIHDSSGRIIGASKIARDITERKRTQRSVQESEERFSRFMGHLPGLAWIKDSQGRYIFVNEAAAGAFGRPREEIYERTDEELFPAATAAQFRENDRRALASESGLQTVETLTPPDGGLRYSIVNKFAIPGAGDESTLIGGMAIDITEQVRTQKALEESEIRNRAILDTSLEAIITIDAEGRVTEFNPAAVEMFGYSREEALGRQLADLIIPTAYQDRHRQGLARFRATGASTLLNRRIEMIARRSDGSEFPIELAIARIPVEQGLLFSGFIRDITERKHIERSLRLLAQTSDVLSALSDFNSTLQKIARLAVPEFADWCVVDIVEPDGSLRRIEVAHKDPTKVEFAQQLQQRYPPDPRADRGVVKVARTGHPEWVARIPRELIETSARDQEHARILKELGLKSYMCVPMIAREKVLGVISFVSAESGRYYTQADLAVANELARRAAVAIDNAALYAEAREADRRKDEFLAMLAHELRNPLAPIRSGLEVLSLEADGESDTIRLMQQQLDHLIRLVDDLLDVSRIVRGRIELRREPVKVSSVIERSVHAIRPVLDGQQQQLNVSVPAEPIWLNADPVRLVQCVENLLNNASKYTDNGGRIDVAVEQGNGEVCIKVRDTGVGIEPELLPKVFDLFTQSSRSLDRSQGGLGIGLTLVRSLVEMHGGSVSARSSGPGHGSEFTIRLPVGTAGRETDAAPAPVQSTQRRRILVVDDNVGAARILSLLLAKIGEHQIETAHDGPSALDKVREMHPEIVLLDIGLPGMDGYEVGRTIRQSPEFDKVLLVALTGYGQEEDRRRSRDAGFDEHLVKPPSIHQMNRVLTHPKLNQDL